MSAVLDQTFSAPVDTDRFAELRGKRTRSANGGT